MDSPRQALAVAWGVAAWTAAAYASLFFDRGTLFFLAGKEQLFEQLGALFFLVASCLAAVVWLRTRRVALALLALFFFIAAGEELSWGQHLFGFEPPEAIGERNRQRELNLHNLEVFDSHADDGRKRGLAALVTSNRLFDYFMGGFFLLIPWAARASAAARRTFDRLGIPVMAPVLGLPLVWNLALTAIAELWRVHDLFTHLAVSEIREMGYAALCLAGVWTLLPVQTDSTGPGRRRRRG